MNLDNVFKPLPWQKAAFLDKSLICLLHGAAGGGKNRLAGEKAHAYAMRYPGASILFLRKTFSTLNDAVLIPFENEVLKGTPYVKKVASTHSYVYANGSRIFCAGMANAKERERIRGIGLQGGLDLVWFDEANAFTEEDFNEILGRMRGRAASWKQIILGTNPDSPTHWIFRRLIEGKEASCHTSSFRDNIYNPEIYTQILEKMTGVQGERLREGRWFQAEGAVYPEFNRDIHIIPRIYMPPHWRRIRSIDFGYKNPFVCQWWAIDHDGCMYMYREIYRTEGLVEDFAREIKELSKDEKIEATLRDHDAEDAATLERHGIPTYPAFKFKTIEPGIQAIKERLLVQPNGKARMYFFNDALVNPDPKLVQFQKLYCTTQEFNAYVYHKPKDGQPIKDEPVKDHDHGMDAMRYAVVYLDNIKDKYGFLPSKEQVKRMDHAIGDLYQSHSPWMKPKSKLSDLW